MTSALHPDEPSHLVACLDCQAEARRTLAETGVRLDRVWSRMGAEMWAPETSTIERVATRVLRSPGLARALVTTPSLLLSWIGATLFVLAVGIVATRSTGVPWVELLAPVLAAAGIGYAYGPGTDPAHELARSMALTNRMVLLVRALAVFGVNAFLGLIASVVASSVTDLTLAWLAPMTAVSALALAIASVTHSPGIGVTGAMAVWAMIVLAGDARTGDAGSALTAALVPVYLLAAGAGVAVALWSTAGKRGGTAVWRP